MQAGERERETERQADRRPDGQTETDRQRRTGKRDASYEKRAAGEE